MKRSIIFSIIVVFVLLCTTVNAQMNVGSNTAPDSSAMLQISGTAKGFLPPRLSRTEMNAIQKPAKGLIVFSTTDSALFMRRDTGWVKILGDGSASALTGDVTSNAGSSVTTISNGAVTNAKLATMPANTFKANNTGSAAAPSDISAADATAMLNTFSSGTKGLVPASGGGTTRFLRADGTFQPITSANGGTVTSVSVTTANGVSGSVTNSTTTPAISLTLGDITPTSVTASGNISSNGTVYVDNNSANTGAKTPGLVFGGASSGEAISSKRTAGASGFGLDFYTNNLSRMSILQNGNIGIGNTSPAYKLHVTAASDPLYLAGVNLGTTTSADSVLTITSGVVKKIPVSTFATPASAWSLTGNSGTNPANNFLGTTDNQNLIFRTNNAQRMLLDASGNVAIGASPTFATYPEKLLVDAGTTSSYNVISGKGNLNNYLQLNIQNKNAGGSASSDVVATADNGDEGNNYVDLGINSSGNTSNYFGGANDAYLYNIGQNFLIGTATESKSLIFMTGGGGNQSTNERMRINSSGNVGIGITSPTNKLHIVGTNPLALGGLQSGTNADSILTVSNGVVKRLAPAALNTAASAWSLTGNSNTSGDGRFLGTTNIEPLIIKVNSQPTGRLDTSNTYLGYQSGYSNGNNTNKNTGIGNHALFSNTSGTYNTAIGYGALQNNQSGAYNIGIGNNAAVANNSSGSIAIGTNTNINNANSIAIGTSAQTNNTNALSIGNNTFTNGNYGISIGNGPGTPKTQAYADYSTALGYNAYAGGTNAIAIGSGTNNGAANAIAIGNGAAASYANSVAIGYNASAQSDNTIVLGDKSNNNVSVAIGPESFSSGNREKLLVDAGNSTSFNIISAKGNTNNYMQLNIQNRNAGGNASSDIVATADNGDETNNYVDLGINSSGNNSGYGAPNDAYLYNLGQNFLIGTGTASKSVVFYTGGGLQSANERMRIDGSGNIGIGIASPSAKLHVSGTNPLTLNGVQTGTSTTADSLLTITSGIVKKLPISTFASPTNSWSTIGNSGTTSGSNFLGTADNVSLKFRTNNTQRLIIDSLGNVGVGTNPLFAADPNRCKFLVDAGITNSYNLIGGKGSINGYLQMNIQNRSNGVNATTDIVATADNGTETSNYVDLGINGSGYAGGNIETGVANDGYLISSGNDFYMVNSSANKSMLFLTGGTGVANERMRILANGRVGMGVQDPTAPFVVKDTMEVRRVGSLSQLLFTNTAGTGDFRIGGDGGDLFWQGGGSRSLQMGSYWTTVLSGDRQTPNYPAFINGAASANTGVLVLAQRDASIPLGIQSNSASQTANLTEWRNSSGTALSAITKDGSMSIGTTTFSATNPEKFLVDAGSGGTNFQNVVVGKGNTNSYAQLNIQNTNAGSAASSDVVATANNGNETTNYIDMGINGGGNNAGNFGDANDAYLYNVGQDLLIGTATANKNLLFLTGGSSQSTNERMRIDGSGNVGIGTTTTGSTLSIGGSVSFPVKTRTAGYTILATDHVVINTGGAVSWTLPDPTTCTGRVYRLINHGTGNITLSRSVTSASGTAGTILQSAAGSNTAEIISDGSVWRKID